MKYISNERALSLSLKKYNNAPWSREKNFKYYASGREALISLIDALGNEVNRVVLLPAYVPQGLYAPFEKRGWSIILYPIDKDLYPLWSEVEALIERYHPTIAILIQYFGTRQLIEKFVEICHKGGTKVIEDHAHLLIPMKEISYQGDYVLYSLPKMVGVADGAVLVIRDSTLELSKLKFYKKRTNRVYITKQIILLFMNSAISKIPNSKIVNLLSAILGKLLNSYKNLMSVYHQPNKISRLSHALVERIDFDKVIKTRSRYARMYEEKLDSNYFTKLLTINDRKAEQRATFGYPVLVKDRDSLYRYLSKRGVYGVYLISNWNYIPKEPHQNSKTYEETQYVIDHHFVFPTARHLKEEDIENIIKYANEWAKD